MHVLLHNGNKNFFDVKLLSKINKDEYFSPLLSKINKDEYFSPMTRSDLESINKINSVSENSFELNY